MKNKPIIIIYDYASLGFYQNFTQIYPKYQSNSLEKSNVVRYKLKQSFQQFKCQIYNDISCVKQRCDQKFMIVINFLANNYWNMFCRDAAVLLVFAFPPFVFIGICLI